MALTSSRKIVDKQSDSERFEGPYQHILVHLGQIGVYYIMKW